MWLVSMSFMQFVFLNILLSLTINQVDSIGSLARGRSPILTRVSALRRSQSNLSLQDVRPSQSSSLGIVQQQSEARSASIASSSTVEAGASSLQQKIPKDCEGSCFHEIDLRPQGAAIIETRPMGSVSGISLQEASEATHGNDPLDPRRDGVYVRVRKILSRYGAPVAVGSAVGTAVGVGASELMHHLVKNETSHQQTSTPSITNHWTRTIAFTQPTTTPATLLHAQMFGITRKNIQTIADTQQISLPTTTQHTQMIVESRKKLITDIDEIIPL